MQAFKAGCILSATVMVGVAAEHTFLLLLEVIETNPTRAGRFAPVAKERTIHGKLNKFRNIMEKELSSLPWDCREDLDTNLSGILSVIRNFRNQSGHPTGQIVGREQAYVLLQLFVTYCKKIYQLMEHYAK